MEMTKSTSKAVGKKPYKYHRKEFILNHETYADNEVAANLMHEGKINDESIMEAFAISNLFKQGSFKQKNSNFDISELVDQNSTMIGLFENLKNVIPLGNGRFKIEGLDGNIDIVKTC